MIFRMTLSLLDLPELAVLPAEPQQFTVGALFDQRALLKNENAVGVDNS